MSVEAVRRRRGCSDAVVAALSRENMRKKQRKRGAEEGKDPKGRTPPLFNHSIEEEVGSHYADMPHGVAVYKPDGPISEEPHGGPQGVADPMTRRIDAVNEEAGQT